MSYAWFLVMYMLIGVLFLWFGLVMLRHPERMTNYLIKTAETNQTPRLLIKWLKYFSMVILVSFIVSWFPFDRQAVIYSVFGFILIYVFGRLLTRWDDLKTILPQKRSGLLSLTRRAGLFLITYAAFSLILWYLHVSAQNV
jgi:hypothetical protein